MRASTIAAPVTPRLPLSALGKWTAGSLVGGTWLLFYMQSSSGVIPHGKND